MWTPSTELIGFIFYPSVNLVIFSLVQLFHSGVLQANGIIKHSSNPSKEDYSTNWTFLATLNGCQIVVNTDDIRFILSVYVYILIKFFLHFVALEYVHFVLGIYVLIIFRKSAVF